MRDIPGLTQQIAARADALSTKAREARDASPLAQPKASISPAKVANGVATLRLYDYIDSEGGYWGISADELAAALDDVGEVERLELRINSGGGAVWDGLAILNTLRSFDKPVHAIVDGVAASAASFIAVACDEVVMMPNSRMMIHDALGLCIGQAVDMREYADFLDDSSDNIAEIYATRTGGKTEDWREVMTSKGLIGQWYSAQEAVDVGLADRIGETAGTSEDNRVPRADQRADQRPGKATTPPEPPAPTQADQAANEQRQREDHHRARQHAEAARRHGLPAA